MDQQTFEEIVNSIVDSLEDSEFENLAVSEIQATELFQELIVE
jgi:hypothetical protein